MAKNFYEVLDEIKERAQASSVKSFSKSDFEKLVRAFVNTPDYECEVVKTKEGEMVKSTVNPVANFRSMIRTILKDFGVDKDEAEKVMTDYEIRTCDMYEFISELIYKYMEAGKKFDFITKEDFSGSMSLKFVEEEEKEFTEIRRKDADPNVPLKKFTQRKKAHKVLEKKSKCPSWLKERV